MHLKTIIVVVLMIDIALTVRLGWLPIKLQHVVDLLCPYNAICSDGPPRLTINNSEEMGCCTVRLERLPIKLQHAVDILCPYNAICSDVPPRLTINNNEEIECCTDCSCDDSCGLDDTCCLSEMHIPGKADRIHQLCLYPTTLTESSKAGDITAFDMVVDVYPRLEGDNCDNDVIPCGIDEYASSIGSFSPVYSKKTGLIYKNKKCAKCHGLDEDYIIEWDVLLKCDNDLLSNDTIFFDVSSAFNSIQSGTLAPNCYYMFYCPGPSTDIISEVCYIDIGLKCVDEFYIDSRLNMTKEEVISACYSSGLNSLYGRKYRNIFCNICSGHTNGAIDLIAFPQRCRTVDLFSKGIIGSSFSSLIYPNTFIGKQKYLSETQENQQDVVACSDQKLRDNQTGAECRSVKCPTGKLRTHDYTCNFPTKIMNKNMFSLNIKLLPETYIKEYDLPSHNTDALALFATESPWSPAWEIKNVVYQSSNETVINEFLITLKFLKRQRAISKVLSDIEMNVNIPWFLTINNKRIRNSQALSKYNRLYKLGRDTVIPIRTLLDPELLPNPIRGDNLPVFKILVYDTRVYTSLLPITKLFLCDQIELKSDEFEMSLELGYLYYKKLNKTLYNGEFAYVFKEDGRRVPRVCIEDMGYTIKHLTSTAYSLDGNILGMCTLMACFRLY